MVQISPIHMYRNIISIASQGEKEREIDICHMHTNASRNSSSLRSRLLLLTLLIEMLGLFYAEAPETWCVGLFVCYFFHIIVRVV